MSWFILLRWLWALPWLGSSNGGMIPRDVNVAIGIAHVTEAEGEHARRWTVALDTWAAFETAYRDVPGDCPGLPVGSRECTRAKGARSCGYWQTPCATTPEGMSIEDQAKQALKFMKDSYRACPSYPMSVYATGKCLEHARFVEFRMTKIRSMLAVPFPVDSSPTSVVQ